MFKYENIFCQGKEKRMSRLLYYTQLAIILQQKQRIWDRNLTRIFRTSIPQKSNLKQQEHEKKLKKNIPHKPMNE